jgi:hypothetical protein
LDYHFEDIAAGSLPRELMDKERILLARGRLPGTLSKMIHPREGFAIEVEFTLDLILASWVGMLYCQDT